LAFSFNLPKGYGEFVGLRDKGFRCGDPHLGGFALELLVVKLEGMGSPEKSIRSQVRSLSVGGGPFQGYREHGDPGASRVCELKREEAKVLGQSRHGCAF
jgi:hypothetical protein